MMSELVNPKNLFSEVDEGDKIGIDGREKPLTVYRHVTEDDAEGQVITMRKVTGDMAQQAQWEFEQEYSDNDAIRAGDLMTGSLTGDEFLILRGPRGGCYLLTLWWDKRGGEWFASPAFYRRTREDNEVWTWENTVSVTKVGNEDVDRNKFDAGGDWVRHTEVRGEDVTVWEDIDEGEVWDYSKDLTGVEPREPTDTGPKPHEVLETVSEGDTVHVNDFDAGTVTDVENHSDGALADGVTIDLDVDGQEMMIRTFSGKGKAMVQIKGENDTEDVQSVEIR